MCGIFGCTDFNPNDLDRARKALHTLSHRGPDQDGDYYDDHLYLGHTRLSIIDLSENGRQPMVSEHAVIAVNGEIYNFQELRRELEDKYRFRSRSDSEVILHGYAEWGIDGLLKRIDGMFAFCIYDRRTRTTYLARDRFGKKPVYYHLSSGGRLLFASEIKTLLEFDDDLRVFSYDGIADWIYHRGSHSPHTIFDGINKLAPGSYLALSDRGCRKVCYYDAVDVALAKLDKPPLRDVGVIRDGLDAAVKKRLISDVPVGIQLSGGVDSSLIAHHVRKNHNGQLHTFSIGFSEPEFAALSEEKYARYVAEKLGFIHHQCNITHEDVAEAYERVIYLCDGMLDYPNTIPIYLLSRFAKPYVTVMLTGEGADELFGGYTKYKRMEALTSGNSAAGAVPMWLLNRLGNSRLRGPARRCYLQKHYGRQPRSILENLNCYISPETFRSIFGECPGSLFDEISYERIAELPFFRQVLLMDHKTYLFSVLDRQDRGSMGAAIESRLPFLDTELVENALGLDRDLLFDHRENKKILKGFSAQLFGDEFTYRPKRGFPVPISDWMHEHSGGLGKYLDRVFLSDFALADRIDMKSVRKVLSPGWFGNRLLNYGDSEAVWVRWFLTAIRTAQDVFHIHSVK